MLTSLMLLTALLSFSQTQDISSGAARTIYDLLRTVPGVEISSTGSLRDQPKVYVRESRNLKGKVAATFVLDNVIYEGDVGMINPVDVASVTVLKDDAAAAAYGARGFGGVILINTKTGKGYVPPTIHSYDKSAYQYFISKGIEIRAIGKDGKEITTGVISKETPTSIFIRKKEILKSNIEKVEIITTNE